MDHKVYMNNGQAPSSFQARFFGIFGWIDSLRFADHWNETFGQVPSTGIVDSNYGNGEVKQVGFT